MERNILLAEVLLDFYASWVPYSIDMEEMTYHGTSPVAGVLDILVGPVEVSSEGVVFGRELEA